MKYLKIFALIFGLSFLASCKSKDEAPEINTAKDVVVSMAKDEISFRENKGIVKVPIKVTGESNGIITATCSVAELGPNPAMDEVHYLMTATTVTIEEGADEGYFEISLVDDREINDPREFILTLESVEGATIGNPNQTIVSITDNDSDPYDRIGGTWEIMCGTSSKGSATFEPYEEGELGYKESYMVDGLCGAPVPANFHWNESAKEATITFTYGSMTYSDGSNDYPAYFCYVDGGYIQDSGTVTFSWKMEDDPTTIEFVSGPQGTFADFWVVYNPGDGWYQAGATQGVTGFRQK